MKKVTKRETHDRLSVSAKYEDGEFKFTLTRRGEQVALTTGNLQVRANAVKFAKCCKCRGKENNGDRIQRIYEVAQKAEKLSQLLALMEE